MGAIALADPGDGPRAGRSRYAVPALLVAGWGGLLAYSAAYLTEDMPLRPAQAGVTQGADAMPRPDDGPRRVVVIAAPEAGAPPVPAEAKEPAKPAVVVAAVQAPPAPPPRPSTTQVSTTQVSTLAPTPAPAHAPTPAPAPVSAEYVGVWGPTPAACGAPSRRRGYLPATITPERAKAGRTLCSFHDGRRAGPAWVMAAECSDRGRRWSSQVRLVVDGDRLTWSSSRGTASYVRCGRRAG